MAAKTALVPKLALNMANTMCYMVMCLSRVIRIRIVQSRVFISETIRSLVITFGPPRMIPNRSPSSDLCVIITIAGKSTGTIYILDLRKPKCKAPADITPVIHPSPDAGYGIIQGVPSAVHYCPWSFRPESFRSKVISSLGHFVLGGISSPGHFGLWSLQSRVISNPGHFDFWLFRPRNISAHGHFDPGSFRTVLFRSRVILISGHFGPGHFDPWLL